jgi:molecular chaperone GrpE
MAEERQDREVQEEDERAAAEDSTAADGLRGAGLVDAGDADEQRQNVLLEEAKAELNALTDRHLRLAAEFDNYRKRVERERGELGSRAQAELIRSLLDSLDDLQRVTSLSPEQSSVAALLEGLRLVEKKLFRALEGAGLETLQPQGEFFDPNGMEALGTVPAEHPEEDDVVAAVFQPGYRFRGVLVRPARVQVKKYQG